ncbi:hypothetical protein RIF29_23285 [Crotalaria pallida]|uniref:FAF domain-containing protein n=1 Tax=Crotalaria pallida TaxID=3830 RepID=A0AAN9IF07_CROPI
MSSSSSSSSSSVYQGLQSCLEPLLMEPRVLSLKLSPPGSNLPITDSLLDNDVKKKPFTNNNIATSTISNDEHDMKSDKDCWSFIQSLSNICNKTDEPEAENVYVHPTIKCSSSMLSAKSLEMCTENLGCETGSNASDSSDEMSSLFSSEISSSSSFIREINRNNSNYVSKRLNRGNNFPPPLTSLTDFGGVRVRPRREDGRLILEAVTSSSPQSYFQAERGNGRLRLSFYESVDDEVNYDDEETDYDAEEEEETEEEEEACDDDEEEESGAEEELEMTKFARPSRCKESGSRVIFGDTYFEQLPSLSLCL